MLFHLHVLPTLLLKTFLEHKHLSGAEAERFHSVPSPTLHHVNTENTGITIY